MTSAAAGWLLPAPHRAAPAAAGCRTGSAASVAAGCPAPGTAPALSHLETLELRQWVPLASKPVNLNLAPLAQLQACKRLDLLFYTVGNPEEQLAAALAKLPALRELAVRLHPEARRSLLAGRLNRLRAQLRLPAVAPVNGVVLYQDDVHSVQLRMPFGDCSSVLGQQLDTQLL